MGVLSRIEVSSNPCEASERIADSLPAPTPLTTTEIRETPTRFAFSAVASATREAAKGVDFFVPLKPIAPAEVCANTSPFSLVKEIMVLFHVARICATAVAGPRRCPSPYSATRRTALSTASRSCSNSSVLFLIIRFFPISLCLFHLSLPGSYGLAHVSAHGPGICFCALPSHRQTLAVSNAPVRTQVLK